MKFIHLIILLPIVFFMSLFSRKVSLYQKKYKQYKNELTDEDLSKLEAKHQQIMNDLEISFEDRNDYIKLLNYFSKFDTLIVLDSRKQLLGYPSILYIYHLLTLAKQSLQKQREIDKENKKIAYYEAGKKASLDNLINHYNQKLEAKGEDKISTLPAKREIQLKRYLAKLKKYDSLFLNFYLMLYSIYPLEKSSLKKDELKYWELFLDLKNFYMVGHATTSQVHKSIAIQIFNLYKKHINEKKLPNTTTVEILKSNIGHLIDLTFQTDKPYKNFNNFEQVAYVKNVVHQFPIFECNQTLSEKQIRRFKFYMIGKNALVPRYIPRNIRKYFLDKYLTTPLTCYQQAVRIKLFGLFQKKI